MKNKHSYFSVLYFLCISLSACSQDSTGRPIGLLKEHSHQLGETILSINEINFQNSPPVQFIQLHHNELTADEVSRAISEEIGINYLQIQNGEKRFVEFYSNRKVHRFDPNRMFSTVGIVKSLKFHSQYNEKALTAVSSFRDFFLNFVHRNKTVVALHNNSDGGFSLADYRRKRIGLVHQNVLHDPDDFFITTDSLLFTKLKEKDFNVVLEFSRLLEDDGSLSIYCSKNEISYVNIEAEHGHKKEQEKMLRTLLEILK